MKLAVWKNKSEYDMLWTLGPIVVALILVFKSPTSVIRNVSRPEVLTKLGTDLKSQVPQFSQFKTASAEFSQSGVMIEIPTSKIFLTGTSDLTSEAESQMKALGSILKAAGGDFQILVEGHTDSSPVVKNKFRYPTNWELSGARAFQVVRIFEQAGIASSRLYGVGYAATRPKATRNPAEAKSQEEDRRIIIHLEPAKN